MSDSMLKRPSLIALLREEQHNRARMKLYLSSYRIPTPGVLSDLLGREPTETKTAVIPNAKDYYADRARSVKLRETTDYLQSLGYASDIVDLRNFNAADTLKQTLDSYDFIWVTGGNTFCLRQEMQRSGFDEIIRGLLDNGTVYGGESAGAVAAGKTLKGVELADDPEFAESVVWDGLNLLPNFILPHVGNAVFNDEISKTQELYKDDASLIELTDLQALVVNGEEIKIVSNG